MNFFYWKCWMNPPLEKACIRTMELHFSILVFPLAFTKVFFNTLLVTNSFLCDRSSLCPHVFSLTRIQTWHLPLQVCVFYPWATADWQLSIMDIILMRYKFLANNNFYWNGCYWLVAICQEKGMVFIMTSFGLFKCIPCEHESDILCCLCYTLYV